MKLVDDPKAAAMKKPAKKSNKRPAKDAQIAEFERKDLGTDVRASGVTPVVIRPKSQPTSILLELDLIEQLREKGGKRGLGYQTIDVMPNNELSRRNRGNCALNPYSA